MRRVGLLALLLGSGAGVAAASAAAQESGSLRLEVSLSDRVLRAYEGDEKVGEYPVAVGQPSYPTPQGSFTVQRVVWNPRWVPPNSGWAAGKEPRAPGEAGNPMGRVKMIFVDPDYYIHSTPDEDSLGQAESHGCIRMRTSDAIALAELVMKYGGEPRSASWFEDVLDESGTTDEVNLSNPIPLKISD